MFWTTNRIIHNDNRKFPHPGLWFLMALSALDCLFGVWFEILGWPVEGKLQSPYGLLTFPPPPAMTFSFMAACSTVD